MAEKKPNILFIMGDDIGWSNISAYNLGMMGYRTPNIDRIAREGALFTDWYGQQSCTAGRAAFITGQSPIRTVCTQSGAPLGSRFWCTFWPSTPSGKRCSMQGRSRRARTIPSPTLM